MPAPRRNPSAGDPRRWYELERWRKRRRAQLRCQPLCVSCLKRGRVSVATIADHVDEHCGNWVAFLTAPLQSLCRECHELKHGRLRAATVQIGLDGWPIDGRYLANIARVLDEDAELS